jgi:DNA-directed RNA polymerase specialized sigma24 family protein
MRPSELHAFVRGDRELCRRLIESHSPRLLAATFAYTLDSDEAHDAVREVGVRAYVRRAHLRSASSLLGWLVTICANVCRSGSRSAMVRARGIDA